jgi:hypothetical protein
MKDNYYRGLAVGGLATAALVGCGTPQSSLPMRMSAVEQSLTQLRTMVHKRTLANSTSTQDYLYVSNQEGQVFVYTYPQSTFVASFTANKSAGGDCSDFQGNVFVTTVNAKLKSTIYEYTNGGTTPIASLSDPGFASACAVDPITGNLAVANRYDKANPYNPDAGDVAVYTNAEGAPKMYYSTQYVFEFCAYDNSGNLYLSAPNFSTKQKVLVRLASGSDSFVQIRVSKALYGEDSVQWDGKYMTISSQEKSLEPKSPLWVYRLSIDGNAARVVGTVTLRNRLNRHQGQLWIREDAIAGITYRGHRNVSMWAYPKGGKPTSTIKKIGDDPTEGLWGLTVSAAPNY